ncbi:hypothetical protein RHS01_03997 [Rhizoctonia solani]|uniref:Uncharacterized protein n=1 Tax=Rhizoctonia solani TaxID=456999 RepID=A0A8H7IF29_9AGAM|nr:hypothetical protein RHS01_03997 [Rhizoctonia solani]
MNALSSARRQYSPRDRLANIGAYGGMLTPRHGDLPPEGFNFAFWRRTVLVVGGAFAFYNFAPSAASAEEKVNALTQYLTISREEGKRATDTHLALAKADADARILTDGATKPRSSGYAIQRVGQQADLSDLRIKTDGQ